ncbi:MAG: RsmE family RNA methyltransferase, partial [Patescibacteria group bacterium]
EQCESTYLPNLKFYNTKLTDYLYNNSIRPTIMELPAKNQQTINSKSSVVVVGPEGGFSKREIEFFNQHKYQFFSFKSNVLPSWIAGYSYFL